MKICSIHIKGYQQFQDTFLDFTHPETGEPLDKICLIGKNGTGKSTLLQLIRSYFIHFDLKITKGTIVIETKDEMNTYLVIESDEIRKKTGGKKSIVTLPNIKTINHFRRKETNILDVKGIFSSPEFLGFSEFKGLNMVKLRTLFEFDKHGLLTFIPAEFFSSNFSSLSDVPETSLNEALELFESLPSVNYVSGDYLKDFWKLLIYHSKKRDSDQSAFENIPENLDKTKKQLLEEFNSKNPKILTKIGELWNRILDHTGLEFDVEGASNPIQLNDNLKAYIKVKATGERIQYNQLSTGIRNFIFRLGHIYSLYFNREIKRGFLLVDEPENSLFPDFLYDLIDIYQEITTDKNGENNTQMFFATHNPIIAAQFEPHERIILEWNEEGTVTAHKGVAPIGDDPNDLLKKDFEVRSLMGAPGEAKFKEYRDLRRELRNTTDPVRKSELVSEISKIGSDYGFVE